MNVLLITQLLRKLGSWTHKPRYFFTAQVWLFVVSLPTNRPKSICDRCVINLLTSLNLLSRLINALLV